MLRYIGCNIIIWCLSGYNAIAHIIDCKTIQCRNTNINCLPNEHCFIQCDEMESCIGSTINCPLNGDCNIKCEGGNSCRDMIINARLSSGNFNLLCSESTDHCKGIKIYGSILHSNTGNFNVSCNGKVRACSNSEIKCPINGDCTINCNGDTSCRWSQIIGPINGNLNINCNGKRSCFDGIFDGRQSSKVSITGCMEFESCFDLSLYCPPKSGNGIKNCFIEGNDNLAGNITIYAINGWDGIDIDYNDTFGIIHDGKMFCGDNYDYECDIARDDWSCINIDDYCNNIDVFSVSTTDFVEITETFNTSIQIIFNIEKSRNHTLEMMIAICFLLLMGLSWIICGIIKHRVKQHHIRKLSVVSNEDTQFDESSDSDIVEALDIQIEMNRVPIVAANYAK